MEHSKPILREKLQLYMYTLKKKRYQISKLTLQLKEPEKGERLNPKLAEGNN